MRKLRNIFFVIISLAFAGISIPATAETSPSLSSSDDMVWHWSAEGNKTKLIKLTVLLDGKIIYEASLPVRLLTRDEYIMEPSTEHGFLKFIFSEKRQLHFDDEDYGHYITEPNQKIQCDIWEAGLEKDSIILGVSFDTGKQILLNTLYKAPMKNDSQDELTKGIIVKTSVK